MKKYVNLFVFVFMIGGLSFAGESTDKVCGEL